MRTMALIAALESLLSVCGWAKDSAERDSALAPKVTITILYDNVECSAELRPDWGFACLVEGVEKTILFDAGADIKVLQHNVQAARVDPEKIQYIVLSHEHGDHTGGLAGVIGGKHLQAIYLPRSPAPRLDSILALAKVKCTVATSPKMLFPGVHVTGGIGSAIIEQSLIIDTPIGGVLITGCAHPGVVSILERAKEILKKEITLVLGGFHMAQYTGEQIESTIDALKSLGVQYCGASHCTGDRAIAAFRESFGNHFVELGAGRIITVNHNEISTAVR